MKKILKQILKQIRSELEKFVSMDGRQRWEYFVSYYLKKTLVFLFLLVCLIWMSMDMFFARDNVVYSGAILGCTVSAEGEELLTTEFLKVMNPGAGKRDRVVLSDDMYMSFMEEEQYNAQTADSALFTMLAAGEFNYLIMDERLLEGYLSMEACYDLSDMVKDLSIDKTRCYVDKNAEIPAVCILPSQQEKIGIEGMSGGNVYIGFVRTSKSEEVDKTFLKYLFEL